MVTQSSVGHCQPIALIQLDTAKITIPRQDVKSD